MVVFLLLINLCLFFNGHCNAVLNNRPIIGVLTVELTENVSTSGNSSMMAFYVKFIEASGARVVPIRIYESREYYEDMLNKVNGVLFPGGDDLLTSKGYGKSGKIIFDLAIEINERGDYFPLWGTCLGFELLNFEAAGKSWMKLCNADDWPTNIGFVDGFNSSRMFSKLPDKMHNIMQKENVAIHFHHWCITPENFSVSGLNKFYKVLAVNEDASGETFISIIEAFKYPFYGVSFHPEKIIFEWSPQNISIPHSAEAIKASQYFGNFFINEARKNHHHFPSKSAENAELIYNYNPVISGNDPSYQMYIFT